MTSENSGLLLSPLQDMSTPEVLYIQFFYRLFFKITKVPESLTPNTTLVRPR